MGKKIVMVSAALLLGVVTPISFAPYDVAPVIVATIAGLLLLCRGRSRRGVAVLSFCFGIGMFGYGVWWVQVSVHQFGLPLIVFSASVTAGLVVIQALHLALFGWLIHSIINADRHIYRYLGVPGLWTLIELLRSWSFTGFPWLLAGYSQTDSPLGGFLPVIGAYGVGFLVMLLAVALMSLVTGQARIAAVGVVSAVLTVGWLAGKHEWVTPIGEQTHEVALIQGAIPQADKWRASLREPSLELYAALSEAHWGKSLIIWPETAIPAFPHEVTDVIARLDQTASATGTTFLTGVPSRNQSSGAYYNSILQLGEVDQKYDKRHLVPFGEYMPFDSVLRPVLNFLSIPMSDFSAGDGRTVTFKVDGFNIGLSICYEDAYSRLVRDSLPLANVLVNVSNDAWFGDTIAPHQHLQIARARAMETGRYLLRATNTGISAIVNHRGEIVARSKQFEPDVVTGSFQAFGGSTPFVTYGALPVALGSLVLTVLALWATRARTT